MVIFFNIYKKFKYWLVSIKISLSAFNFNSCKSELWNINIFLIIYFHDFHALSALHVLDRKIRWFKKLNVWLYSCLYLLLSTLRSWSEVRLIFVKKSSSLHSKIFCCLQIAYKLYKYVILVLYLYFLNYSLLHSVNFVNMLEFFKKFV